MDCASNKIYKSGVCREHNDYINILEPEQAILGISHFVQSAKFKYIPGVNI